MGKKKILSNEIRREASDGKQIGAAFPKQQKATAPCPLSCSSAFEANPFDFVVLQTAHSSLSPAPPTLARLEILIL